MKLTLDNRITQVDFDSDEDIGLREQSWLVAYLTFEDSANSFYMADGKAGYSGTKRRMLYNYRLGGFPAGLTGMVYRTALKNKFHVEVVDTRKWPANPLGQGVCDWLYDFQHDSVDKLLSRTRGVLSVPTGGGKCLHPGTAVLMYDGTRKEAGAIRTGDLLMGPDSQPRRVLSTCTGVSDLYEVVPLKGKGFICNDVHVLTLAKTGTSELVDIPLDEYQCKSKWYKHMHKYVRASTIVFSEEGPLPMDPYVAGVWLGDGKKDQKSAILHNTDAEVIAAWDTWAQGHGATLRNYEKREGFCPAWGATTARGTPNTALDELRIAFPSSSVNPAYTTASVQDRLEFIAGVCDTDGYLHNKTYEVVQKRDDYAESIAFVARSLGFLVVVADKYVKGVRYNKLSIQGDVSRIPVRVPRRIAETRRQKKDVLKCGFRVGALGPGDYAGFTLDGDGRFLLGDFTVTHNTELACGLMLRTPDVRWLFLAPEADLMLNAAYRWEKRTGEKAGLLGDGKDDHEGKRIVCATFQTVSRRLSEPTKRHRMEEFLKSFQGVIVDEVHQCPADSNYGVLTAMPNAFYRCGLSGTALSRTDRRNMYTIAAIGDVVYEIKPKLLIERGFIARPNIRFVPHTVPAPKNKTFQGAYREVITNSKERNALLARIAEKAVKPCLLFVKHEKHGKELERILKGRGNCSVEFIYGKHTTEQREKAIERLSWGDLDIAICSKIWQTGTDIPDLRSLVIGTGGASAIETIQRVGRALRVVRDDDGNLVKDSADIWDIWDTDEKVVNPETGRKKHTKAKWFEDHSKLRQSHYLANGYPVNMLEPDECVMFGVVK